MIRTILCVILCLIMILGFILIPIFSIGVMSNNIRSGIIHVEEE